MRARGAASGQLLRIEGGAAGHERIDLELRQVVNQIRARTLANGSP
jgi:hypothetical protein